MLRKLTAFFEIQIAEIEGGASGEDRDHAMQLASAALLLEMTRADHDIKPVEQAAVRDALGRAFALSEAESANIVALAQAEVEEATSLHEFIKIINESLDDDAKARLVEMMWRVAYADGELDKYEEHLVRQLAELTHVPHTRFIQAKLRAKEAVIGNG